jgi:hypothetical protein
MNSIEGTWIGAGTDISLSDGQINKSESKLVMVIEHIEDHTYAVKTQYFSFNGLLETEENFLILRKGNEFISEDPTGNGINYFEFEHECSLELNKLTYKYNLNGNVEYNSLNGKYLLNKE